MSVPDLGPVRFEERRDAGAMLSATVAILRSAARPLALGYSTIVLPVMLLSFVADRIALADSETLIETLYPTDAPLAGLLNGLSTTLWLAFSGAFVRLYRSRASPADISLGDLWSGTTRWFFPTFGYGFATGLLLLLTAGIAGAVLFSVTPVLALGAVPVVLLVVTLTNVGFGVRIIEDERSMEAFSRARRLISGRWLSVSAAVVGSWIIVLMLYVAVGGGLAVVVTLVLAVAGSDADPTAHWAWVAVDTALSLTFLYPSVMCFVAHGSLVAEHGGRLWTELDHLAGAPADDLAAGDAPLVGDPDPAAPGSPVATADDAGTPGDLTGDPPPGGFRGGGYAP